MARATLRMSARPCRPCVEVSPLIISKDEDEEESNSRSLIDMDSTRKLVGLAKDDDSGRFRVGSSSSINDIAGAVSMPGVKSRL